VSYTVLCQACFTRLFPPEVQQEELTVGVIAGSCGCCGAPVGGARAYHPIRERAVSEAVNHSLTTQLSELYARLSQVVSDSPAAFRCGEAALQKMRAALRSDMIGQEPMARFCGMPVYADPTLPTDEIRMISGAEHAAWIEARRLR